MFKQTDTTDQSMMVKSGKSNNNKAVSAEQLMEFARLTGRFNSSFKIGKPTNIIIGKSVN